MKIVPDVAKCISRPRLSLADASANEHSRSVQLYVNIVHFLNLMLAVLKRVPLERWIQFMIGGFKTVNLAFVNKVAVFGYTWLFVYESIIATRKECKYPRMMGLPPWCSVSAVFFHYRERSFQEVI